MLESIINPKVTEKGPWKLFFIGLIYASLSIILGELFFANDPVLSKFLGILVVTFCVMFSIPFMYFVIKNEEKQDENTEGLWSVWKIHGDAIFAFMFLFLGFIVAFSFWNIVIGNPDLFNAQLETYCAINNQADIENCIAKYGFSQNSAGLTGEVTQTGRLLSIIQNNIYVMIFTLFFSIIFGAGAIFVLAWNASVISAAIGVFAKYQIENIPLGILRYMIHGFPEIAAYFITALAGGIFGIGVIRNGLGDKKFLRVLENVVILLFIALIVLLFAALLEVYFTPILFN